MKISSISAAAPLLLAAVLPLATRAVIPLVDDLVKLESWSYVPVSDPLVGWVGPWECGRKAWGGRGGRHTTKDTGHSRRPPSNHHTQNENFADCIGADPKSWVRVVA